MMLPASLSLSNMPLVSQTRVLTCPHAHIKSLQDFDITLEDMGAEVAKEQWGVENLSHHFLPLIRYRRAKVRRRLSSLVASGAMPALPYSWYKDTAALLRINQAEFKLICTSAISLTQAKKQVGHFEPELVAGRGA